MTAAARIGDRLVPAEAYRCLSCNACRSACTMHGATSRLQPLKLVRMATLGLHEHLLEAPELWYCLQCNQCGHACPMHLEPSSLIAHLRDEAVRRGVLNQQRRAQLDALFDGLQRARWHGIARCAAGEDIDGAAEHYESWSRAPVPARVAPVNLGDGSGARRALDERLGFSADLAACMTCGACTSVCPLTGDRSAYDPVVLFRMVNLGLVHEVLGSPALWLCLGCRRCTKTCTQAVAGHLVLDSLRALAVERGVVPRDMHERVWALHRELFPRFLERVDALVGNTGPRSTHVPLIP